MTSPSPYTLHLDAVLTRNYPNGLPARVRGVRGTVPLSRAGYERAVSYLTALQRSGHAPHDQAPAEPDGEPDGQDDAIDPDAPIPYALTDLGMRA